MNAVCAARSSSACSAGPAASGARSRQCWVWISRSAAVCLDITVAHLPARWRWAAAGRSSFPRAEAIETVRTIDNQQVVERLDYRALIEALRSAFGGCGVHAALSRLETGTSGDSKVLLIKSAWDEDVTVVKALTLNESNRQAGTPFVQGLVSIFDKPTGTPLGVVDGREITCRRTAAASALAADYLAVPDAEVLTIIGTGALAPHMALAHAVTRPLRQINVFGRNADKAETTAAAIGRSLPAIRVRAVFGSSRSCSRCAYRLHGDIQQGHRSCTAPGFRTVRTSILLVDSRPIPGRPTIRRSPERVSIWTTGNATLTEAGDIVLPIANGTITAQDIVGDLWDLCRGQVGGRSSDHEVTVFKSVGTALEDLVAARLIVRPDRPG